MNNDIYSIDFTRSLPDSLKYDPKILTLSKIMSDELLKVSNEINNVVIYARIDYLPENILDIIAYDLKVDWYDYSWPIDVKRATIKDSVKIHKRLGTPYAVNTAIGNLHPNSEIEEWFDYEGKPHRFRIVLDTTNSRLNIDIDQILKAVKYYKRKTSIMEEVIFQCSINCIAKSERDYFRFNSNTTNKSKTGEKPYRNTIGAEFDDAINIIIENSEFNYSTDEAGTKPNRNIVGFIQNQHIGVEVKKEIFEYSNGITGVDKSGEKSYRNVIFETRDNSINIATEQDNFNYKGQVTGVSHSRKEPYRNTCGAEGESEALINELEVENFSYKVKKCGMNLCKRK